jgi:predicted MFS family arabinose efflux permease
VTAAARGADRYAILVLILTAQTFANVGPLGIPAIAGLIREDLGLTLTQAGSFLSAYYIGPILMSLPAGTMADRWGVKPTLVAGQAVIALGLFAVSAAGTYPLLIVLMSAAGVGYGMLNPTSTKAVMAWSPPARRATLVGLKQVGLPFGGALGAALLPLLAVAIGWRLAVVSSAGLIAVSAVATAFVYRDPPARPVDPAAARKGALRAVLRTRALWLVAGATLLFAGLQTVFMAFFALDLQERVGLSLLAAGRYLALAQVSGMAGRIAFGVLSDRVFDGAR